MRLLKLLVLIEISWRSGLRWGVIIDVVIIFSSLVKFVKEILWFFIYILHSLFRQTIFIVLAFGNFLDVMYYVQLFLLIWPIILNTTSIDVADSTSWPSIHHIVATAVDVSRCWLDKLTPLSARIIVSFQTNLSWIVYLWKTLVRMVALLLIVLGLFLLNGGFLLLILALDTTF